MTAEPAGSALMRRVASRLAGLQPITQRHLVAVRAKCPLCNPAGDGGHRPLEVACFGEKTAPRWACELGCDRQELDRVLVRVLEGRGHV